MDYPTPSALNEQPTESAFKLGNTAYNYDCLGLDAEFRAMFDALAPNILDDGYCDEADDVMTTPYY